MNYQVAPFWFYSGKVFLLVFFAVGLALLGITALIFYGLLFGVFFPVIISMRLHRLKEKSLVAIPKEMSQWTVYVQGIPVQETRSSLTNPCFAIQEHLRTFFMRAFISKFIIQAIALLMLVVQMRQIYSVWLLSIGLLAAVWLIIKCVDTAKTLVEVMNQRWLLDEVQGKTGSVWYRAGFSRRGRSMTALETLLKLT
ncbi:hypothetical protein [Serratia aquatilis]|uniref:Inner membrane protein n=1 Tax=Serratia aquatilis TaxID=1737515 RepID=A0ABV6EDE5_9GAMM